MTPEDRSFILQIVGLIIVAIVGYFTKKNQEELAKSREERQDLKQGLTAVSEKVSDVILKFDPLTHTLDGQLDKIKRTLEDFGNLKGRSELLAEQAATAAIVASAVAASPVAANPASTPTAANPLLTEKRAEEIMDNQTVIADRGEGWGGEEPQAPRR